jgi:hypothetical protein
VGHPYLELSDQKIPLDQILESPSWTYLMCVSMYVYLYIIRCEYFTLCIYYYVIYTLYIYTCVCINYICILYIYIYLFMCVLYIIYIYLPVGGIGPQYPKYDWTLKAWLFNQQPENGWPLGPLQHANHPLFGEIC